MRLLQYFFIVVAVLLAGLACSGCGRARATPAQKSPDGSMTLSTSVNSDQSDPSRRYCVIVEIRDAKGKVLHHEITPASNTQRWSIGWVGNDEVLLKSSDVGNYHIRREADGKWKGTLTAE